MHAGPSAHPVCEFLEWDSKFFERRIARAAVRSLTSLNVDEVLDWCRAQHIDCLYFLTDATDGLSVSLAEENRFSFVDVRVTLERRSGQGLGAVPPFVGQVREWQPADVASLRAIASTGFRLTRFYYDRRFPSAKVDLLYATWIEQSCGGYADSVLVADVQGEPVGFVTCHVHSDKTGQVGLLGVRDDSQGQGLGRVLLSGALGWFADRGSPVVRVVTQGRNRGALRTYQQCGFLIDAVELYYHRWFGREGEHAKKESARRQSGKAESRDQTARDDGARNT